MRTARLALLLFLTACAPAPRGFVRLQGASNHLEVPIFQGEPPVIYTHVTLGEVSGRAAASSSVAEQKFRALYNLSKVAREKGANAVIGVTGQTTEAGGFVYSGRAVVFDVIP